MNSNYLNKRVRIEREITTTNSLGTPEENYSFYRDTWAARRIVTGGTQLLDGELPFTSIEWTLRWDPLIDYKTRIGHDGQWYKIRHIASDGRHDWTRILTTVWEEDE